MTSLENSLRIAEQLQSLDMLEVVHICHPPIRYLSLPLSLTLIEAFAIEVPFERKKEQGGDVLIDNNKETYCCLLQR